MALVVCTRPLPIDLAAALPGDTVLVTLDWRAHLADAAALIVTLRERIDDAVMDAAPHLRVIASYAVGVDNIDVEAATRRGIAVTNTPDVLTDATADLTWALILAAARGLGPAERDLRSGAWTGWEPTQFLGLELRGATLAIVGAGRIGQAVAARAGGFGMHVRLVGRGDGLADALADVDVISLHCPLTPSTRGLIDAAAIARMKPTAILINTARGPIVDENALVDALEAGQLGAAALDVYDGEPQLNPRLRTCPRLTLAPHLGSATTTARRRMAELCVAAVRAVLSGQPPAHLVNPAMWLQG